jgi:Flp pilus assembly protein TadD
MASGQLQTAAGSAYDSAMKTAVTALAWAALFGCAGAPPAARWSGGQDAYAALIDGSAIAAAADEDVLTLPPEADALLARVLAGHASAEQKLRALSKLFERNGGLGLRYELLANGTAADTLEQRIGSCLSFTHLYIALARRVGLDARYREVVTVPQWDRAGEYALLNRHVVAYGEIPFRGAYTMDFGLVEGDLQQFGRVVSDDRARAQHFNNNGADALTGGDPARAVSYFNRALIIDPALPYVWSNLGTAYMRLGDPTRAEIALRHAQRLAPFDVTPLNQLARLYSLNGDFARATAYIERAGAARLRNPYVLYQQGLEARTSGEFDRAIDLFRRALRVQPDEVHFLIELGATYRLTGRIDRAKKTLFEAAALVDTVEERSALIDAIGVPPEAAGES